MLTGYVHRPRYERALREHAGDGMVKVVTGVRRCGKSSLLGNLAGELEGELGPGNVFYRRMDQFDVPLYPTAEWLQDEVAEALRQADDDRPFCVLLDEVQEVRDWEKVVRRLQARQGTDVYLTGSNAHVLSSDLATLLGGRYVQLPVLPLSFSEYLDFAEASSLVFEGVDAAFSEYVRYGGMPAQFVMTRRDERAVSELLQSVYETVILNDVALRVGIGDLDLLAKLVRFVFSTSGCLFSTRSVVNSLASEGRKTTVDTVDNYLRALEEAYIVSECEQMGLVGRKVLRPLRKYYPADTGLRNLMTRFSPSDFGAQLECVVYNELVRRGLDVKVGSLRAGEVDFVAEGLGGMAYYQVSETLRGDETFSREVRPLEAVQNAFPKVVLTLDRFRTGTTDSGVQVMSLVDWLLTERA